MEITALVSRVNYYNKENGYAVMIVTLEKDQFKILKTNFRIVFFIILEMPLLFCRLTLVFLVLTI